MTQIDFYILAPQSHRNVELLTCQLTEKAYLQNNFVNIYCQSAKQTNILDELLWKFKPDSFLPHITLANITQQKIDDFHYPVLINGSDSIPDGFNPDKLSELLINLTNSTPGFFSQFHRLAEIVDKDEKSRQHARERFRFYKERGYVLATHNV